jgi:hypothetical protein
VVLASTDEETSERDSITPLKSQPFPRMIHHKTTKLQQYNNTTIQRAVHAHSGWGLRVLPPAHLASVLVNSVALDPGS